MAGSGEKIVSSLGNQRAAVFIDGSNLYHSLQENCGRFDLDFGAFAAKLCKGRSLFRAYYYNVLRDPDKNPQAFQDQQKFLTVLYSTPYLEVRLGTSKPRGETAVEKGIDIMLATDLLRLAWNDHYDVAVLVSGDGDFAYALKAVKDMGKYVEVAAFASNLSWELVQAADDRQSFTPEFFSDLWSRQRAASPGGNSQPQESRQDEQGRRGWRLGRRRAD